MGNGAVLSLWDSRPPPHSNGDRLTPPGVSPSLLSLLLRRALRSSLVSCGVFLGAPGISAPVVGCSFAAEIYDGFPSLNCTKK